jgi:biotin--protein ligase
MNVIVYAGPEVVQSSLLRITGALKSLLFPNYTVQTLTSQVIGSQPWSLNCALLVLPECDRFVPTPESARVRIQSYVEKGGIALALRAAMRQSQQPPHDGTLYFKHRALGYISMDAKTSVIPSNLTPGRKEEDGTAPIALRHDSTIGNVDAGSADEVLALAIHEGDDKVRGAVFSADLGKIAIWFPIGESHSHGSDPVDASLLADQMSFLRHTLVKLGIQVPTPAQDPQFGARPTVQYLVSRHSLSAIDQVAEALSLRFKADDIVVFEDTNDVFNYRLYSPAALEDARQQVIYPHDDPSTWQPKHVLVCSDGVLPSKSETPMFDLHAFYDALYPQSTLASGAQTWRIGDVLYFGNVVTSTQTMLDKCVWYT